MKKKSFSFLLFLIFSSYLTAQQIEIDSVLSLAESLKYSNPPAADSLYQIIIDKANPEKDIAQLGTAYKGKGVVADVQGDLEKSLLNYELGFQEFLKIEDTLSAYKCRFNSGMIYRKLQLYKQAKETFEETNIYFDQYDFELGTIFCQINLGITLYDQEEYNQALEIFLLAKEKSLAVGHSDPNLYGNIGNCYLEMKMIDSAKLYLKSAFEMASQANSAFGMVGYGPSLAELYLNSGELEDAISISSTVHEIASNYEMSEDIIRSSKLLSKLHAKNKSFEKAYHFLLESTLLNDSVQNSDFLLELQNKEEYIKNQEAQNDLAVAREKEKANQLELGKKNLINKGLIAVGTLVLLIAILLFRQSKKRRELNLKLQVKNEQIEIQHKEIIDSITYAKRIQLALLPPDQTIKKHLKDSFILYKPKDIVAGDFYWLEAKDDLVLFAAADCTGHGVPGAMVSVVCNNALNRSVREYNILDPGKILDKSRDIVIEEFEKSKEEVKDGMDISLCTINNKKLKFAGANNPLWIVRDGELIQIKGNKQPVGKYESPQDFTTHEFDLKSQDTIYLFSDGYADQFGGQKGKKFKARALRELLLKIHRNPMNEQKEILDSALEEWKGDLEQIDDICIMGVRVA